MPLSGRDHHTQTPRPPTPASEPPRPPSPTPDRRGHTPRPRPRTISHHRNTITDHHPQYEHKTRPTCHKDSQSAGQTGRRKEPQKARASRIGRAFTPYRLRIPGSICAHTRRAVEHRLDRYTYHMADAALSAPPRTSKLSDRGTRAHATTATHAGPGGLCTAEGEAAGAAVRTTTNIAAAQASDSLE